MEIKGNGEHCRQESHWKHTDIFYLQQDTMITKGVASVRSPVCNLQQFSDKITHDTFTSAIVQEFQNEYGINTPVRMLKFAHVLI